MNYLTYSVQIEPKHGAYMATVPALPGCVGFGGSIEESLIAAKQLIDRRLQRLALRGHPMPIEAEPPLSQAITVQAPLPVIC